MLTVIAILIAISAVFSSKTIRYLAKKARQ
jgi:hypothetical protein